MSNYKVPMMQSGGYFQGNYEQSEYSSNANYQYGYPLQQTIEPRLTQEFR